MATLLPAEALVIVQRITNPFRRRDVCDVRVNDVNDAGAAAIGDNKAQLEELGG